MNQIQDTLTRWAVTPAAGATGSSGSGLWTGEDIYYPLGNTGGGGLPDAFEGAYLKYRDGAWEAGPTGPPGVELGVGADADPDAVAIGLAPCTAGGQAVAIGGAVIALNDAVAIGVNAGCNDGSPAVCINSGASINSGVGLGNSTAANGAVVLNASGSPMVGADGFFVKPVRGAGGPQMLYFDGTQEITRGAVNIGNTATLSTIVTGAVTISNSPNATFTPVVGGVYIIQVLLFNPSGAVWSTGDYIDISLLDTTTAADLGHSVITYDQWRSDIPQGTYFAKQLIFTSAAVNDVRVTCLGENYSAAYIGNVGVSVQVVKVNGS
jgi:hypothetical protein